MLFALAQRVNGNGCVVQILDEQCLLSRVQRVAYDCLTFLNVCGLDRLLPFLVGLNPLLPRCLRGLLGFLLLGLRFVVLAFLLGPFDQCGLKLIGVVLILCPDLVSPALAGRWLRNQKYKSH